MCGCGWLYSVPLGPRISRREAIERTRFNGKLAGKCLAGELRREGRTVNISPLRGVASFIALSVALAIQASAALAADQSKPGVFVHSYENDSGANCDVIWNDMKKALAEQGWTGPLIDLSYYVNDAGCGSSINQDGSHSTHYASGHSDGGHTTGTNIRHLGYHLAWWIYDHYGKSGQCIEAVGHSMGGLIIRYAIAQVDNGNPDFPPSICVEDVVTLGTPHAGTPWAWGCSSLQCVQMRGNVLCDGASASAFIQWLRAYAWDPDGVGGSQWTLLGSQADLTVPSNCALRNMAAYGRTKYLLSSGVSHAEYIHLTSENDTADVSYKRGSSDWTTDYTSPWPVKWSRLALSETTW